MGALKSHVIGYGRRFHQGSGVVWGDGHMTHWHVAVGEDSSMQTIGFSYRLACYLLTHEHVFGA